jgi:hypothetical protein
MNGGWCHDPHQRGLSLSSARACVTCGLGEAMVASVGVGRHCRALVVFLARVLGSVPSRVEATAA